MRPCADEVMQISGSTALVGGDRVVGVGRGG